MRKELLLYGIHRLAHGFSFAGIGRKPNLEDIKIVIDTIPKRKYSASIFADLEDLKRALEELVEEGLVEEGGGGYALTPRGEAAALEIATWSTGYAGYMRQLVERCVKLYLALELFAWAR